VTAHVIVASIFRYYTFLLILRLVLEYVRMFKPDWRPRGLMLPIAEIIFLFTDPPLKLARRIIPPLRMGAVGVDLSYIAVFFGLSIIENIILKVIPVK